MRKLAKFESRRSGLKEQGCVPGSEAVSSQFAALPDLAFLLTIDVPGCRGGRGGEGRERGGGGGGKGGRVPWGGGGWQQPHLMWKEPKQLQPFP